MRLLFVFSFVVASVSAQAQSNTRFTSMQGGFVRADTSCKDLTLLFTADEWGEGLPHIRKTLKKTGVKGSFFFTGRFYQNPKYKNVIRQLAKDGHYLGPHSHQHLLYCDWAKRDSLLVKKDSFETDLRQNLAAMKNLGLPIHLPHYFVPPYEWWNDSIAAWSRQMGLMIVSFTPGIRTNADYTWPEMGAAYKSTEWILNWLNDSLTHSPQVLNGAIFLIHAGTDPRRKDKLYLHLGALIHTLQKNGFVFRSLEEFLPLSVIF
jgi:peptidoglycan/xylan/chitin deacetylase (PgdA/CDA1 family)